jgi:hypothetical protein
MALGFDPDFDEGNVGTIVLSRDSMKKWAGACHEESHSRLR